MRLETRPQNRDRLRALMAARHVLPQFRRHPATPSSDPNLWQPGTSGTSRTARGPSRRPRPGRSTSRARTDIVCPRARCGPPRAPWRHAVCPPRSHAPPELSQHRRAADPCRRRASLSHAIRAQSRAQEVVYTQRSRAEASRRRDSCLRCGSQHYAPATRSAPHLLVG